jgi:hypothetical protein
MVAQAVCNFKFKRTKKAITPHGGIPFLVRYIHGSGLIGLANKYLAILDISIITAIAPLSPGNPEL